MGGRKTSLVREEKNRGEGDVKMDRKHVTHAYIYELRG